MNDKLEASQLIWEDTACGWCGSEQCIPVISGPDRMYDLPGLFTFVKCSRCGTHRQNPRLKWTSLKEYYPQTYGSYTHLASQQSGLLSRLNTRYEWWKRLRIIEKYQKNGGRLLDVGCGTGALLESALRSGRWLPAGVEPNHYAASYVRENLKVPVYEEVFADADLPQADFDAIVFWNVLEHSYNPIDDLRKAHALLKDGGWLIIGIPNLNSWERYAFGPDWIGWELPRHLYLFPMPIMRDVLESLGFRWETAQCMTSGHGTFGLSLGLWMQNWDVKYSRLKNFLLGFQKSIPARLSALPFWWVSNRFNRSSIITVVAQKPRK